MPFQILKCPFQSGEYILGFQVKPEERLEQTCKAIQALLSAFQSAPIFGVQFSRQDAAAASSAQTDVPIVPREMEEQEPEEKPLRVDAYAVNS